MAVYATPPHERVILTEEGAKRLLEQRPVAGHRERVERMVSRLNITSDLLSERKMRELREENARLRDEVDTLRRKSDFNWFIANYDTLFKQHGVGYYAIKDERILGVYDSASAALSQTLTTERAGTFIIQQCTGSGKNDYTAYIATPFIAG